MNFSLPIPFYDSKTVATGTYEVRIKDALASTVSSAFNLAGIKAGSSFNAYGYNVVIMDITYSDTMYIKINVSSISGQMQEAGIEWSTLLFAGLGLASLIALTVLVDKVTRVVENPVVGIGIIVLCIIALIVIVKQLKKG
jgi:hypothetical protein